jgi:ribosome maturation factor RimP
MSFSFTKLVGLPGERVLAIVEPILAAHGLDGVELIWKTDNRGWVLYLTIERQGSQQTGAGVTLDDCSELSRDLSAALDVDDVIAAAYRLEVGTPGIERRLYTLGDYQRFAGQTVKVKLQKPVNGEYTLRGELRGVNESNQVLLSWEPRGKDARDNAAEDSDASATPLALDPNDIQLAHLVLEWGPEPRPVSNKPTGSKKQKPASDAAKKQVKHGS